jgi:hypothetical protein
MPALFRRAWMIMPALLFAVAQASAQREAPLRPGQAERQLELLKVGQLAPDFALSRLDPFLATNTVSSAQKVESVRLSALRGKRPVVLILSSFT